MNLPTRVIAFCLTSCVCLTDAKCWSWPTVRDRSKTQEKRATIFSATKITGNVTTVILPGCLIRKSGHNSRRANKNCVTRLRAIRNCGRPPARTIGSKTRRPKSPGTRRCTTILNRNGQYRLVIASPERSSEICLNTRGCCFVPWRNEPNPMASGFPNFATARANHWNWNFFRVSPFTTITRSCAWLIHWPISLPNLARTIRS